MLHIRPGGEPGSTTSVLRSSHWGDVTSGLIRVRTGSKRPQTYQRRSNQAKPASGHGEGLPSAGDSESPRSRLGWTSRRRPTSLRQNCDGCFEPRSPIDCCCLASGSEDTARN